MQFPTPGKTGLQSLSTVKSATVAASMGIHLLWHPACIPVL